MGCTVENVADESANNLIRSSKRQKHERTALKKSRFAGKRFCFSSRFHIWGKRGA
jgi:hypothetical protein